MMSIIRPNFNDEAEDTFTVGATDEKKKKQFAKDAKLMLGTDTFCQDD